MDKVGKALVNISLESVMLAILIFLLITCFTQKKKFATTKPLIFLTSFNILLLVVQIIEWITFKNDYTSTHSLTLNRILYSLDYFLYYAVAASFYYYVVIHIKDLCKEKNVKFNINKWFGRVVIIVGAVLATAYTIGMFVDNFYYIKDGVEVFNSTLYIIFFVLGTYAVINSIITIIIYRKVLTHTERILLLLYVALPNALAIVDVFNSYAFSYVLMSIFIFILYIHIDTRRGQVINAQEKTLAEKEKSLNELQTQIMLSQMQPHFLYNVLTTISALCDIENAPQARDVTNRFADYFRTNLDSMGKEKFIPFEREFEHVKTYLWLEKIRFEDALNVIYEIGATDFMVPSLTVQPLIENAVKHGLRQKEGGGSVLLKTYENEDEYIIIVEDDGAGFDIHEVKNDHLTHVGLKNVAERIKIVCNGHLDIESTKGVGTTITIHLPKNEVSKK